jgi:hypothetical protein
MSIKNKKTLSGVILLLNLCAVVICVCFPFFERYNPFTGDNKVYGFHIYSSIWYWILLAVFGIISFIYDGLIVAMYIIETDKVKTINKMMRYGAFFGAIIAIINFFALLSFGVIQFTLFGVNMFFVVLIAIIAIKIILLFSEKTERVAQEVKAS